MRLHSKNPALQSLFEQLLSFGFSRKRLRESADPLVVSELVLFDSVTTYFIEVDLVNGAVKVGRDRVEPMVTRFDSTDERVARRVVGTLMQEVGGAIWRAHTEPAPEVSDHQRLVLNPAYAFDCN